MPDWPAAFGGAGLSDLQCYLWWRALSEAGAPRPDPVAVDWVGPALWLAGSRAQQQRWLPDIRDLNVGWCMLLEGLRVPRSSVAGRSGAIT
ncbi:MAG: acyl-CoA dehydrogenase family protein, partial [Gammaproteobacteria bacterium]